ncbi:MAG: nucleotide exchange factor GrpE [Demequinaceae bacterium]|nr:nucleotide exchange factor GrpE [Demequinaceae bacterium]
MTDTTGFTSPDDDGAEDALSEAERILDAAGASADAFSNDEARADDALAAVESKAAEHLADLQRLQAEYINYRKRVDRDRLAMGESAMSKVIEAMLPVLDDVAAARAHGDLKDGPFASIAEKLEETLGRLGWSSFGAAGDPFDPALHEALMSQPSGDVTEPTVVHVAQPGHRVGDRVVRPARVVVAQPEEN